MPGVFFHLLISDGQRTCLECTDFTPCHSCKHAVEAGDDCIKKLLEEWISVPMEDAQGIPDTAADDLQRDQLVAKAIEQCGKAKNVESAWWWHPRALESYNELCDKKKKKKKEVVVQTGNTSKVPTPDNTYVTGTI